jgi:DNA repair protein RadA
MLSERQKYLGEFLTQANNMIGYHKIAGIWTNQVMINPGVFYGDPVTVIGGTVMAHKSTYRVYFKKSGVFRIAKMIDSPKTGTIEVTFGLSVAGVVDKEVAEELEKARKKAKADAKKSEKKEEIEDEEE